MYVWLDVLHRSMKLTETYGGWIKLQDSAEFTGVSIIVAIINL